MLARSQFEEVEFASLPKLTNDLHSFILGLYPWHSSAREILTVGSQDQHPLREVVERIEHGEAVSVTCRFAKRHQFSMANGSEQSPMTSTDG